MNATPYREEYVYLSGQSILDMKKAMEKFYEIVDNLSGLLDDFIPESLIIHGLKPSILTLCANIEANYKITARCIFQGDESRLSDNIEILTYQIVQELAINAIKHANAKNLTVEIQKSAHRIFLKVSDDGKGFNKAPQFSKTDGGLNKIRVKLAKLAGWISISPQPEGGTKVAVEINF